MKQKSNIELCYRATHKQTHEVREGTFEDLQNLDKRVWDLELCKQVLKLQPLAIVEVIESYEPSGVPHIFKIKEIYNFQDLKGLYV